jgi:hypothetical protein
MERVTEKDQAIRRKETFGHCLGCHPTSKGFSTNHENLRSVPRMMAQKPADALPGTDQYLLPVRRPAALFPVEEVETHDKEASFGKAMGYRGKKGVLQIICRPMGQDDSTGLACGIIIGCSEDS